MNKIKEFFQKSKAKVATGALAAGVILGGSSLKTHAADSSVGTLLTGVQTGMMSEIGAALPIAGIVFGAIAGIMIGIKIFKRVTGART